MDTTGRDDRLASKTAIPQHTVTLDQAMARLRPDTREVAFAPASWRDLHNFADLVRDLWRRTGAANPDSLAALSERASALGFALECWSVAGDRYAVLLERPAYRRGGGSYVFRMTGAGGGAIASRPPDIALQVPHPYFEHRVAQIAVQAFFAAPVRQRLRVLFMSTIHRYQTEPGSRKRGDRNPADVSHNPLHLFSAGTRATAEVASFLHVFQLHGFGDREGARAGIDAIVSATAADDVVEGHSESNELTDKIASLLQRRFSAFAMRRYPNEIGELGGVTNAQRRILAQYPNTVFVHLELSQRFRKHLARDAAAVGGFARVLTDVARRKP